MLPIKDDRPMLWLLKAIYEIDQRRLSAPVRSHKSYRLSFFDRQINTIDDVIVSDMSLKIFDM